jgi:hypothetical protein
LVTRLLYSSGNKVDLKAITLPKDRTMCSCQHQLRFLKKLYASDGTTQRPKKRKAGDSASDADGEREDDFESACLPPKKVAKTTKRVAKKKVAGELVTTTEKKAANKATKDVQQVVKKLEPMSIFGGMAVDSDDDEAFQSAEEGGDDMAGSA